MSAPKRVLPGIPTSAPPNGYVLVGFKSQAQHAAAMAGAHRELVQKLASLANATPPNDLDMEHDFDAVQGRLAVQALMDHAIQTGVDMSLLMPVIKVVSAFDQREKGGDPDLFKTVKGGLGGRPGLSSLIESRRGYAVLLMSLIQKRDRISWIAASDRAAAKISDIPGRHFWHDEKKAKHKVRGVDLREWRGDLNDRAKDDPFRVRIEELLSVALAHPTFAEGQLVNLLHDFRDGRHELLNLLKESERTGKVISSVGPRET